jgi:3-oxoacyl-[acyl-carrier-protein] synthase-3
MTENGQEQPGHWLTLQSADSGSSWGCRIESVGVKLPAERLTTRDLMSETSHRTRIQLERLTGIHERRVVGPGENSFTLAAGAARDCLSHSQHRASDLQMLINTSITRSKGQFSQSFEPPLSLEEQRIRKGDRVMLLALASGIEIGIAIFTVDSMVDRYGNSH